MGIAGAGNCGTALATFFGPRLAATWGWHAVFGLALIPLLATLTVLLIIAKDSPDQPPPRPFTDYAAVLKLADTWWFCFFYAITFGGFVGLASFLNVFFLSQYGLSKVEAGGFATLCVIAGSLLRPLGGYLADRFGGVRVLTALYLVVGATMLGMSALPSLFAGTAPVVRGHDGCWVWATGDVFQIVSQRFPREIGVVTGIVGAAGGLGGFVLPIVLGVLKQTLGSFGGGFLAFALAGGLGGALTLASVSRGWQGLFLGEGGRAVESRSGPALRPDQGRGRRLSLVRRTGTTERHVYARSLHGRIVTRARAVAGLTDTVADELPTGNALSPPYTIVTDFFRTVLGLTDTVADPLLSGTMLMTLSFFFCLTSKVTCRRAHQSRAVKAGPPPRGSVTRLSSSC